MDISQFIDLNHEEFLEHYPTAAMLKDYSILISDYYKGRITIDEFTSSLRSHNVSDEKILQVTQYIDNLKPTNNQD